MNRREFLWTSSVALAGVTLGGSEMSWGETSSPEGWRKFEVTTVVEVLKPVGETKIWLPAALIQSTPFQRTLSNQYSANAKMVEYKPQDLGIVAAIFPAGVRPVLTLSSEVELKNYSVDLSKPRKVQPAPKQALQYFLQAREHMPTDGIVKSTATEITKGAKTDVE